MRPPRQDIAAPPFPPDLEWLGGRRPKLDKLVTVGPLLVHFFDFAQLNSVRTLDYVSEWRRRYRDRGLAVLGIHSPRLSLTRPATGVEAAVERLGIDWPVAVDADLRTFRDYGCQGWPSLFLWGKGGALRWYHLGEGEYQGTEEAIRAALTEADESNGGWPDLVSPLRPGDEPGAEVIAPTPEWFPNEDGEPLPLGGNDDVLVDYEAAGAWAAAGGSGTVAVKIDGEEERTLEVDGPGLYLLRDGERTEKHQLGLEGSGSVELHSLQFAPGPA